VKRKKKKSGHAPSGGSIWPPLGGSVWVTLPGSAWATAGGSASPTPVAQYGAPADMCAVPCGLQRGCGVWCQRLSLADYVAVTGTRGGAAVHVAFALGGVSFGGRSQRPRFGFSSPEGYTACSSFTHLLTLPRIIWNPTNRSSAAALKEIEGTAPGLGIRLSSHPVQKPEDIDVAFASVTRAPAGTLIILTDPLVVSEKARIVRLAAARGFPTIYGLREFVDAGGLMSYGPSLADLWRRAATYVDKILKGAKPADLPVEQPTKFKFVVNRASSES
jgi:hypothetical protein